MTSKEKQIQLAKYRLKQAKESPRSIINRAYYGMFYAVLALIVFEPYAYSKHSGKEEIIENIPISPINRLNLS